MSVSSGDLADRPLGRQEVAGDRSVVARRVIWMLAALLALTFALSLLSGASNIAPSLLVRSWIDPASGAGADLARARIVIFDIRLPRAVLGMLIGAALAISGAVMQGVFRNPLADPGIVGITAGASLGAIGIIVLGGTAALAPFVSVMGIFALPLAAFCGALTVTLLLYRIATRGGATSIATLLLAGIALGAMASAFSGLMIFIADDQQLRDLTFWGLGSLAGATWTKIAAAGLPIILSLLLVPYLSGGLNAFALGEATAHHLGVRVERFKAVAIIAVAASTGAAVAVSGGIGFIGIVVPHLLRLLIGPDNRYLLPASALLGATFLLMADSLARTIVAPAEMPIGIITAAVGAPFFLWLLLRRRSLLDM